MNARSLVAQVEGLVTLPEVWTRVRDLLDDPGATTGQMAEVIGVDPAFTARLLRLVNSAYFGLSGRVETVGQAVMVVGTEGVRNLLLATSVTQVFRGVPPEFVDMETFWHHSVCCGLGARLIAGRRGLPERERFFVAGLLHDLGHLVIYREIPARAREVLARAGAVDDELYRLEREVLGFTHAEVGEELLRAWGLEGALSEAVAFHHEPTRAKDHRLEAAATHVANAVANTIEPGRKSGRVPWRGGRAVDPAAWSLLGLSDEVVSEIKADMLGEALEVLEILSPGATLIF